MATLTEKLNPPIIEGTLPAFYAEEGTAELAVPFFLNRAVSAAAVIGITARIKTVQSNTVLLNVQCNNRNKAFEDMCAYFTIPEATLQRMSIGEYFKVQIAFVGQNGTGYYSTVGIVKYTSRPTLSINGAGSDDGSSLPFKYTYTGVYTQPKDSSEKVNMYIFNLYDSHKILVQTSGWLIHDSSTEDNSMTLDYSRQSIDTYTFVEDLQPYQLYYLEYGVRTINEMEFFSPLYSIMDTEGIKPQLNATLVATNIFDEGYIRVSLTPDNSASNWTRGAYRLSRTSQDSDFSLWQEIYRVVFFAATPLNQWEFKDFTVEQGKTYQYAIQQYNDNELYSAKKYSEKVFADFEDMFLFDGKRSLKIKYNPKVSSFKLNHLEQKTDTIGSKYPFITRNGNVEYHEFPISGLISYLADNNQNFMSYKELGIGLEGDVSRSAYVPYGVDPGLVADLKRTETTNVDYSLPYSNVPTTQLVGYNMSAERIFKNAVLEWLGNGESKLFRSPGEGNYVVRLINVSLSPEDRVGRMLHTFSATAYEVAENSYESLSSFGFVDNTDPNKMYYSYETVNFIENNTVKWGQQLNKHAIRGYLLFENVQPGFKINLGSVNGSQGSYVIGPTGTLRIELGYDTIPDIFIPEKDASLESINRFSANNGAKATVTYRYLTKVANKFALIKEVASSNSLQTYVPTTKSIDIVADINSNIKRELFMFYELTFFKKEHDKNKFYLSASDSQYYFDRDCTKIVHYFSKIKIYDIYDNVTDAFLGYYTGDDTDKPIYICGEKEVLDEGWYYKCGDDDIYFGDDDKKFVRLHPNGCYYPAGEYNIVEVGFGFYVTCYYQIKTVSYEIENTDESLRVLKATYGENSQIYLNTLKIKIKELEEQMEKEE